MSHAKSAKRTRRATRPPGPGRAASAPRASTGGTGEGPAALAAEPIVPAGCAAALPALPPALDIRKISETFEVLRSAVNCGVDSIDASRVVSVDTAGLQLLLAAGRTAAAHGRALRWAGASSTLVEAATRLGVAGLLGLTRPG